MNRQDALGEFFNKHPRKHLRLGNLDWTYMIGGTGSDALVILPGSLNSAEMGFEHVEILEEDFKVIAPAYPGKASSMGQLVDGVIAILDAEGFRKAHVLGSSFGGQVAQCLVRLYPDRIGKLVLSDTGGPVAGRAEKNEKMLQRLKFMPTFLLHYLMKMGMRKAASRFSEDQEFWKIYMVNAVGEIRKESFVSSYKRSVDFDRNFKFLPSDLPDAPSRVLLLDSDDDPITEDDSPESLRILYPGAALYTFEDTGHMASILKPQEYAGVIRAFLKRL